MGGSRPDTGSIPQGSTDRWPSGNSLGSPALRQAWTSPLIAFVARGEADHDAGVFVVAWEEIDANLFGHPGMVVDREVLVELAHAPLQDKRDRILTVLVATQFKASVTCRPIKLSSVRPVNSNTPFPLDSTRPSWSHVRNPAWAGGKKSSKISNM